MRIDEFSKTPDNTVSMVERIRLADVGFDLVSILSYICTKSLSSSMKIPRLESTIVSEPHLDSTINKESILHGDLCW
jgi:hypothetical protein